MTSKRKAKAKAVPVAGAPVDAGGIAPAPAFGDGPVAPVARVRQARAFVEGELAEALLDGDAAAADGEATPARRRSRAAQLEELVARLPTEPGVYLMKDRRGRVIYVGKAKDLRARVTQYFKGGDERTFVVTGALGRLLDDIETVVVGNEKEALLLENNLIKQHQPRFNVKLTDDKNFIVLRIDTKKAYPRVEVGRRLGDDGARYFGPFHSATSARETLRLVNRHFQLRTCTDQVLANRQRPCMLHQIKRCPAPCVYPVDRAGYAEQVEDAALLLAGKNDALVPRLRTRMKEAAAALEYERAAQLRDQIGAVEATLTRQVVVQTDIVDQDVLGFHRSADAVEVAVMFMRQGKLLGRRAFQLKDQEIPDAEVLRGFLLRYYELGGIVPDEVLLPVALDDAEALGEWLAAKRGARVSVLWPQRGDKVALLELARKNAEASAASRHGQADAIAALGKLQRRLGLRHLPRRIECFDIAHLQGAATVASMVVMVDGVAERASYRRFRVKTVTNDDFAAMYEVLSRRLRRARENVPGWDAPDLLVVDGGKGQLSTALAALRDVGLDRVGEDGLDVIGLAKERDTVTGEEQPDRVFVRGVKDPIALRPNSTELFVLARIRDEAHRFANTYHGKLRSKRLVRSSLDDVTGVGDKRKKLLLGHFGSLKRLAAATLEELAAVPGVGKKAAQAVRSFLDARGGLAGAAEGGAGEGGADADAVTGEGAEGADKGLRDDEGGAFGDDFALAAEDAAPYAEGSGEIPATRSPAASESLADELIPQLDDELPEEP